MTKQLTGEHQLQLENIKKMTASIGAKESSFLKVELLFYEAMDIARLYGNDVEENKLLAALKRLQANAYSDTKVLLKKSSQQEQVIRRFISQFKAILSSGSKNLFYTPA
ncbi:MAG: hypothetical protein EON98_02305 [Chitinophagaceae bacterium]|nr:MAG: hypothetical protein EON98_02305 [Chitinophagaceae bacterium]